MNHMCSTISQKKKKEEKKGGGGGSKRFTICARLPVLCNIHYRNTKSKNKKQKRKKERKPAHFHQEILNSLGICFLHQRSPQLFGTSHGAAEKMAILQHGKTVVDDDVHPLSEPPDVEVEGSCRAHKADEVFNWDF